MKNQPARHPEISGPFLRIGDEIKAARGKTSSERFDLSAKFYEERAGRGEFFAARYERQTQEIEHVTALLIGEHPERREEIEAFAKESKQGLEITKERHLADARRNREYAQNHRNHAQQARDFEARFAFDVYTDRALDALEREQREQREAKPRRKPTGRAR